MMLLIAFSDDSVTNPVVVITKKEKKHLNMTIQDAKQEKQKLILDLKERLLIKGDEPFLNRIIESVQL